MVLDRKLADRSAYPVLDVNKSGTRKEELLLGEDIIQGMWLLRKVINPLNAQDGIEWLLDKMKGTKSNKEFMDMMKG